MDIYTYYTYSARFANHRRPPVFGSWVWHSMFAFRARILHHRVAHLWIKLKRQGWAKLMPCWSQVGPSWGQAEAHLERKIIQKSVPEGLLEGVWGPCWAQKSVLGALLGGSWGHLGPKSQSRPPRVRRWASKGLPGTPQLGAKIQHKST